MFVFARYTKMVEWMDNVEMAIQKVCASKVYTSAEFKREKDNFHVRHQEIVLKQKIYTLNDILKNSSHSAKILRELRPRNG